MSLLTSYEGLRHQIERLVRENEELKKLVRLIRENHELKSAIRTQAAGLGLSGFGSRPSEAAASSAPCQGVFLPPPPATASESVLEEMGVVALSPLSEMLNSPQSSPLTGPLNMLLSSPGPMSQSTQLTSILTSPVAVTPMGTLTSSLGLPSTGPLLPNGPLAGPVAMSQGGALTSSLGLPSTGPLLPNGPLAGSMAMSQGGALTSSLGLPSTGSLMSSGPLVGPVAMSQGGTLTGSLGLPSTGPLMPNGPLVGPVAMSQGGALTGSLGLPLTGPLTPSSLLAGPVAMSQGGALTGSLGLPLTGPLTPSSPLAGPGAMSQGSPLMAPMTSSAGLSLSSPLFTSTPTSPGAPQNLPANPMSSLVASETQRARLAEPPQGAPTSPPPTTSTVPAATSKVATERPRPPQDPESLGVTLAGAPVQPSSPISAAAPAGPVTAFQGASDARTQPGAPPGPATPTSVPAPPPNPTLAPSATHANFTPSSTTQAGQSARQGPAPAHHTPPRPSPSHCSPQRNPHSPPRTSSSPAAVQETRGPRGPEAARKNVQDPERKLTQRKTSKFPDSAREPKQLAWERLVGEIAFQLDRRILSSIFPERVRLYGFTVSNIPEKIIQASLNPHDHKLDEDLCQTLTQRYVSVMNRLQSLGYNGRVHPALTEQLVNAYGILRERPELAASEGGSYTVDFLQRVLAETVHPSVLTDALLLLSCLSQLARDDGKPMFIW
ncbi:Speriolin [Galemys pyrenaicus]|uniref:Speriolin n=1 Tax=Galemys pyrenaicus TaxID=202257 RepID=A0A8J6A5D2_GALPY|nr:Speriolin [Galemys pyrenaicus]